MKMYGTEISQKPGYWLCDKCKTWVVANSKVCPWCSNKKPNMDEIQDTNSSANSPTKSDAALYEFLKTATEEQKKSIIRFIEDQF